MAVTFMNHKVMHFDRRHRASPSNHAAQTTAHCSPEAGCFSCCLITFSRSGADRHSEYQKGRKAVLLILRKSSARSTFIASWLFNGCSFTSRNVVLFCLCYLPAHPAAVPNILICQKSQNVLKIKVIKCLLCYSIWAEKWITAPDLRNLITELG